MSKSLLGQRDAVLGDPVDELADQVVAVAALALAGELVARTRRPRATTGERNGRCGTARTPRCREDVGVVGVGVADHPVAPLDELAGHLVGHVEQAGQHPDRVVGAIDFDEVELLAGRSAASTVTAVSPRRNVS